MVRLFPAISRFFSKPEADCAGRKTRRHFETLEARSLLAADLSINSFTANGVDLVVDFNIAQETTGEFNIAIYRSFDGVPEENFLLSRRIEAGLGVGSHQVVIPAAFSDLLMDFELRAVIDDGGEIVEGQEGNNQIVFGGGAFVDADNVLQIHGTAGDDIVTIYNNGYSGYLHIDWNNSQFFYFSNTIARIAARTHSGYDWLLADYGLTFSVAAFGGADSDFLLGGAGNDVFFGGSGNDYLIGGSDTDLLFGEEGFDFLDGDEGDDFLNGGEDLDYLYGGNGNDTIGKSSGGSNYHGYGDIIDAGEGDDYIYGTSSADIINGGGGNDSIFGLGGNDQLFGDDGYDYLSGGDGDDWLEGGTGRDYLNGGAGADILGNGSDDSSYTGYGDILEAGEGDDTIYGTNGDDVIYGGDGNDSIYGLGGNDRLYGGEGDDYLDGGEGDDYLDGGSNDDLLIGGSGHDAHLGGGQAGDTVGDRPSFSNFLYRYRGEDREVFVSGNIIDDEPVADLKVNYSGIAQGTIPLSESGEFRYIIAVPELGNGWLYLDFTDAEGLQAQRMTMALT